MSLLLHESARSDLARLLDERDRYKRALEKILDYWLGDTSAKQVLVDHMKDISHLALFGKHRV